MSINASNEFHNKGVFSTLRRSFTLKRFSQNRFSLNPRNDVTVESISTATIAFKQSLSSAAECPLSRNGTQTLGRPRRFEELISGSALDQARKNFWDDEENNERTNVSKKFHPEENKNFVKTLKRNMSVHLVNLLKRPEEIKKCLEKAKKLFQTSEFKESKKLFENLLGSKHLDTLEKKSEISLYLAAIYLLEKNGSKVNPSLEGNSFLQLVMGHHAAYLADPEHKNIPFSYASFYGSLPESASKDEKAIAKKLLESFEKNTPTQGIQ